ncbi:MAG: SgrR family transcriptional regulator [bacterium]
MVEDDRYFRLKRGVPRDADLKKISPEGGYLLLVLLNRAFYDLGTCAFSFQEAASLLECSRKKATGELEELRENGYIEYQPAQGKHRFEVKLNFYYSVDPKKEQVKTNKEQVVEQAKSSTNTTQASSQKDKSENKSGRSNTMQYNAMECNEIQRNEDLSFFHTLVPKSYLDEYGYENVCRKIALLTFQYKDKSPDNPLGVLKNALKENYAPSDKFLKKEKEDQYGSATPLRSNTGLSQPFAANSALTGGTTND